MKLPNFIINILEWIIKHPILTIIIIYSIACIINLFAPLATNRGSWWNILFWMLRLVSSI